MLRSIFQYFADEKTYRVHQEQLIDAVRAQDLMSIEIILSELRGMNMDRFLEQNGPARRPDYITSNFERLLEDAIETDNISIFEAIYSLRPDPNMVLSSSQREIFSHRSTRHTPLLQQAIMSDKPAIADYIMNDPDFDIDRHDPNAQYTVTFISLAGFRGVAPMSTTVYYVDSPDSNVADLSPQTQAIVDTLTAHAKGPDAQTSAPRTPPAPS